MGSKVYIGMSRHGSESSKRISAGFILPPAPSESDVETVHVPKIMPLVTRMRALPTAAAYLPTLIPPSRQRAAQDEAGEVDEKEDAGSRSSVRKLILPPSQG